MATQNIPIVNVHVVPVSKEIEREKKRAELAKRPGGAGTDRVSVGTRDGGGVAAPAEVTTPPSPHGARDFHENLKHKRAVLEGLVKEAGENPSQKELEGEKIEAVAFDVLSKVEEDILDLQGRGKGGAGPARLEQLRERLSAALGSWRVARLEASGAFSQSSNDLHNRSSNGNGATTSEEEALWKELKTGFASKYAVAVDAQDSQSVQTRFFEKIRTESLNLKNQKSELEAEIAKLQAKVKEAPSVEARAKAEKEFKAAEVKLAAVLQKIKVLQEDFSKITHLTETLYKVEVAKELGQESHQILTSQSVVKDEQGEAGEKYQGKLQRTPSGPLTTLHTESASSAASSSLEEESSYTNVAAVATSAADDFSGTTLAIASMGNKLKQDAKATDATIKRLMLAVAAGNWEAIKTCLILLGKKASLITTNMGAQTLKSMQYYEKQMSGLSRLLGKLKGDEPDYNARLAKINSDMNLYSLNRQAIANFLRDTMTMKEEELNLTQSVLQKDAQITASISR